VGEGGGGGRGTTASAAAAAVSTVAVTPTSSAADEAAASLRAPPAAVLNWGALVRVAHSLDDFARWLMQGSTVFNSVLFAPLVVSALGLAV